MRITEHRVLEYYGKLGGVGVNSGLTGGSSMEWGAGSTRVEVSGCSRYRKGTEIHISIQVIAFYWGGS